MFKWWRHSSDGWRRDEAIDYGARHILGELARKLGYQPTLTHTGGAYARATVRDIDTEGGGWQSRDGQLSVRNVHAIVAPDNLEPPKAALALAQADQTRAIVDALLKRLGLTATVEKTLSFAAMRRTMDVGLPDSPPRVTLSPVPLTGEQAVAAALTDVLGTEEGGCFNRETVSKAAWQALAHFTGKQLDEL